MKCDKNKNNGDDDDDVCKSSSNFLVTARKILIFPKFWRLEEEIVVDLLRKL